MPCVETISALLKVLLIYELLEVWDVSWDVLDMLRELLLNRLLLNLETFNGLDVTWTVYDVLQTELDDCIDWLHVVHVLKQWRYVASGLIPQPLPRQLLVSAMDWCHVPAAVWSPPSCVNSGPSLLLLLCWEWICFADWARYDVFCCFRVFCCCW